MKMPVRVKNLLKSLHSDMLDVQVYALIIRTDGSAKGIEKNIMEVYG
jgi:hypothetical protein